MRYGNNFHNTSQRGRNVNEFKTLFHTAIRNGASNCLKFLLDKSMGTNNLDNPDFKGKTPLHRVIESLVNNYTESNLSCLKLLLEKRAFVNARDVYGDTPLHLLAELISDIKCDVTAVNVCLKLLLKESSLDVDSVNKSERTALQVLSSQFETNCSTDG